jgi:hypothetical protein
VFIDGTFASYSTSGGAPYSQQMALTKLYASDNWHFMFGTKWVGYWSRSYFDTNGLCDTANGITFGGEVSDDGSTAIPTLLHTTTRMGGDGTFGSNAGRWQHAAYQKRMQSQYTVNGSLSVPLRGTACRNRRDGAGRTAIGVLARDELSGGADPGQRDEGALPTAERAEKSPALAPGLIRGGCSTLAAIQ